MNPTKSMARPNHPETFTHSLTFSPAPSDTDAALEESAPGPRPVMPAPARPLFAAQLVKAGHDRGRGVAPDSSNLDPPKFPRPDRVSPTPPGPVPKGRVA